MLAIALGALVRLIMAWSGVGNALAWRIEVSTAANSNLELREGIELYRLGVSPYSGSSSRIPPLALWLHAPWADLDVLYVVPNIVFDVLAALLLHRLASKLLARSANAATGMNQPDAGAKIPRGPSGSSAIPAVLAWAYLLNPFSLAASAAGTTSPLEGLAVVIALYSAAHRRLGLACLGLAVASYMSLHTLVLMLPVACLAAYGPEDIATPLHMLPPPPPAGADTGGKAPTSDTQGAAAAVPPPQHPQPRPSPPVSDRPAGSPSSSNSSKWRPQAPATDVKHTAGEGQVLGRGGDSEVEAQGVPRGGGHAHEQTSGPGSGQEQVEGHGKGLGTQGQQDESEEAEDEGAEPTSQKKKKRPKKKRAKKKAAGDAVADAGAAAVAIAPGRVAAGPASGNPVPDGNTGGAAAAPFADGSTVRAAAGGTERKATAAPPAAQAPKYVAHQRPPLLPWSFMARCCMALVLWLLLLAAASDLFLEPLAPAAAARGRPAQPGSSPSAASPDASPQCLVPFVENLVLQPPWRPVLDNLLAPWLRTGKASGAGGDGGGLHARSAPRAASEPAADGGDAGSGPAVPARLAAAAAVLVAEVRGRMAAARQTAGACWAVRVYGSQVLLDDVTPNVGQWWYLMMEAFEDSKVYIRLLAHSLLFALGPPLAIRLGTRRPLALFLLHLLSLSLLKPYPSVADLGLAVSLLPLLARQQLAGLQLRLLLPASLALLCVLGPAMLGMWLDHESANSNFFYSVTLLGGVWQVVLLGQVLGLTIWVDRVARGKADLKV